MQGRLIGQLHSEKNQLTSPADVHDSVAAHEVLFRLRLTHPEVTIVRADLADAGTLVDWAELFLHLGLVVAGETAVVRQPAEGPLGHPASEDHRQPCAAGVASDDFDVDREAGAVVGGFAGQPVPPVLSQTLAAVTRTAGSRPRGVDTQGAGGLQTVELVEDPFLRPGGEVAVDRLHGAKSCGRQRQGIPARSTWRLASMMRRTGFLIVSLLGGGPIRGCRLL
ncbi:hypothetical protein BIV23_38950 [Streptomyces monashensis]|uniref:Uncharacterized protein n=1 Tax=Streptomyces monashensis TaxID=1678012 RepID=A0A1S2PG15_9ACTN|nr:hypothetical protein BIV23_38950 [Streptomyces monashensis]